PVVLVGLGGSKRAKVCAFLSSSFVAATFSLSEEPFWPGTTSKELGARAISFAPTPRTPPTLITKASTLPLLSNRISLTSPIFSLSDPTTSVPLNLDASHWSGFWDDTKFVL